MYVAITIENVTKFVTNSMSQIQEVQRIPSSIPIKTSRPSNNLFKLETVKKQEKIFLKTQRRRHLIYRETRVKITMAFNSHTMHLRRKLN